LREIAEAKREKVRLWAEKEKVEQDVEAIQDAEQLLLALECEDQVKHVRHREFKLKQDAGHAPTTGTSRAAVTDIIRLDDDVIILEKVDQNYVNGWGARDRIQHTSAF
jgi:hypothetical protein